MNEMRLQKFLARAGVASRRHSEELIAAGRVAVNGHVVTVLGTKVDPAADEVAVDGDPVALPEQSVTLMLHKPAGYVTTMDDPQGRPCVAELVPDVPGLYPIGRLDADTTGLLLFSTDGDLGHALLHPRTHVRKRYLALVEGAPSADSAAALRQGIQLDDGLTAPAEVDVLEGAARDAALAAIGEGEGASGWSGRHPKGQSRDQQRRDAAVLQVGLFEGRKRQVRRMLEAVGHPVLALHRASVGGLELGALPRGTWRELTADELVLLG